MSIVVDHGKAPGELPKIYKLGIVGGGPKGLAVAAKASVLNKLGRSNIEVTVFEKRIIGANWSGNHGFTDGEQSLGTPADKDIAFPHKSEYGDEVVREMLRFSWMHYRVLATKDFAMWTDSGRPQPKHAEFSKYMQWLKDEIPAKCIIGEVTEIHPQANKQIDIHYRVDDKPCWARFDGVVLTGPGSPISVENQYDGDHVIDGRRYWQRRGIFSAAKKDISVAIVGGGETAATILLDIIKSAPGNVPTLINRHGLTFSRGESPSENEIYTDPKRWGDFDEFQREEFIKRTDRGVFSQDAIAELRKLPASSYIPVSGNVKAIIQSGNKIAVRIERGKQKNITNLLFDYVIVALGFDPVKPLLGMLKNHQQPKRWVESLHRREVDDAFRIRLPGPNNSEWEIANIHMPMLSGKTQGPGFPNLSCLGLLSDRVVRPYVMPAT